LYGDNHVLVDHEEYKDAIDPTPDVAVVVVGCCGCGRCSMLLGIGRDQACGHDDDDDDDDRGPCRHFVL
jgi:hypothetical protein